MTVLKTITVGIALTFAVPAAAATTINFDQLPDGTTLPTSGTTISTQYASLGVTFSGRNTVTGNTGPLNSWGDIPANGPGGSRNYLASFGQITPSSQVPGPNDYLLAPRYDISTLTFSTTVSGVSFGLYTGGGQNSVNINAYDAGGTLLQSLTNVQANEGRFDVKTLSATGIARIDLIGGFNSPFSARIYGIDNLTFTVDAAVPEPATWAMMIAGFGMTGSAMRRRKPQTAVAA